jgi:hypothetical protein
MGENMQSAESPMENMEEREQSPAPAEVTVENQPETLTANLHIRSLRSGPTANTNPKLTVRS